MSNNNQKKKNMKTSTQQVVMMSPEELEKRKIRRAAKKEAKKHVKREMNQVVEPHRRQQGQLSKPILKASFLPRTEQHELQSVVDSVPGKAMERYLKTLVMPSISKSRIPDSFASKTALFSSSLVIDVPAYFTGMGADAGRFAMAIRPSMGRLSQADDYKVALVKPKLSGGNYSWPTNLAEKFNFQALIGGKDLRLDPFTATLTQPPLSGLSLTGGSFPNQAQMPFGLTVKRPPVQEDGYGLEVEYLTAPADTGLVFPTSAFYPPPGFYHVDIEIVLMASAAGASALPVIITTPGSNATFYPIVQQDGVDDTSGVWSGYINIPKTTGSAKQGFYVTYNNTGTDPFNRSAYISFVTSYADVDSVSYNNGLIQKYRPVACSALASFVGPTLTDGGSITAALVPGEGVQDQFFNNNTSGYTGSLAGWQNLAQLSGAYTGPIRDGAYCYYVPSGVNDTLFRTPDEASDYNFPTIVISGVSAPGQTNQPDGQAVIRLIVSTVYEFTTDSVLFEQEHQKGTQAMMDMVFNHISEYPTAMQNAEHVSFANKVLGAFKKAGTWVLKNGRTLGTVASMLGTLI